VTRISVITPTWGRHDLLLDRCIPSVLAQDHPDVEHVVVSDGPDAELYDKIRALYPHVVYKQLLEHHTWIRWGVRARLAGIEAASGEYLAWLDDDNSFRPGHVPQLAALLAAGAGFAYSTILMHQHGGHTYPVGSDPPCLGGIDTSAIMHRRSLLEFGTWRDDGPGQPTIDWDIVQRWMAAGATWAFDPEVTADYYFAGVHP